MSGKFYIENQLIVSQHWKFKLRSLRKILFIQSSIFFLNLFPSMSQFFPWYDIWIHHWRSAYQQSEVMWNMPNFPRNYFDFPKWLKRIYCICTQEHSHSPHIILTLYYCGSATTGTFKYRKAGTWLLASTGQWKQEWPNILQCRHYQLSRKRGKKGLNELFITCCTEYKCTYVFIYF